MHAKPTYGKLDNLPFRLTCDQWAKDNITYLLNFSGNRSLWPVS